MERRPGLCPRGTYPGRARIIPMRTSGRRLAAGRAGAPGNAGGGVPTATRQTMTIIPGVAAAVTAAAAARAAIVGTRLLASADSAGGFSRQHQPRGDGRRRRNGRARNNRPGDNQASSGSAGGGIVMIRAGGLSGTATITANGLASYNGTSNDAGGGGGAGGSTSLCFPTAVAKAGLPSALKAAAGGDAWDSEAFARC